MISFRSQIYLDSSHDWIVAIDEYRLFGEDRLQ